MISPQWIIGLPQVAPVANTTLWKVFPTQGKLGAMYGVRIVSQEVNAAGKVWQYGYTFSGVFTPIGELDVLNPIIDSNVPMLMLLGFASGTGMFGGSFEVRNLLAGTAATRHQASVKYAEFDIQDLPGFILGGK